MNILKNSESEILLDVIITCPCDQTMFKLILRYGLRMEERTTV
jgi:hypothetical protein